MIEIVEVGPRDGLQNESKFLERSVRETFIHKLVESGLRRIEVGAFVNPRKIPQMADSKELIREIIADQKKDSSFSRVQFSALVPNEQGMRDAVGTGISEVAVFTAVSETFTRKNINCTVDESFERFEPVLSLAKKNKIKVRGYLSTCFACPYEGPVAEVQVIKAVGRLLKIGVYEVSVGDTIGVATPKQVKSLVGKLIKKFGERKIAMHFHDTRGTALANILASLELGIKTFDASLGGLGGCPYAPGASGNVSTEDVVYMLHGMGIKTGVDLEKLIATNRWIANKIDRELPSRVGKSGLPKYRI